MVLRGLNAMAVAPLIRMPSSVLVVRPSVAWSPARRRATLPSFLARTLALLVRFDISETKVEPSELYARSTTSSPQSITRAPAFLVVGSQRCTAPFSESATADASVVPSGLKASAVTSTRASSSWASSHHREVLQRTIGVISAGGGKDLPTALVCERAHRAGVADETSVVMVAAEREK